MGTGIVSLLLFELPYNGKWLYWISVAIFALNVLLFILFTFISALRYFLYRGLWQAMICHPVVSLFLGTFPISLSLIVEMVVVICVPAWGEGAITLVSENRRLINFGRILTCQGRRGYYGGLTL